MKKATWFYILYGVFLLALGGLMLENAKGELHQLLTLDWLEKCNKTTVLLCDAFFKYITEIGSSIPFIVAGALLFVKFGYAYFVLLAQLAVTVVVQPIKHWLNAPRPKLFFAENFPDVVLHQVDGVALHSTKSFPSGHTASAFAFMLCVALLARREWVSAACLVVAVWAGYSRIYLSQHFAEDVFAGSIVGVAAATLTYWFYTKKTYAWQQESLLTILKKDRKL